MSEKTGYFSKCNDCPHKKECRMRTHLLEMIHVMEEK